MELEEPLSSGGWHPGVPALIPLSFSLGATRTAPRQLLPWVVAAGSEAFENGLAPSPSHGPHQTHLENWVCCLWLPRTGYAGQVSPSQHRPVLPFPSCLHQAVGQLGFACSMQPSAVAGQVLVRFPWLWQSPFPQH